MPTYTIDLPEEQAAQIREMLAAGRYQNESDVIRAALRALEREEEDFQENQEWLRAEVQKGMDAIEEGRYIELNSKEDIDAYFEDMKRRNLERWAREKHAPQSSTQWSGE